MFVFEHYIWYHVRFLLFCRSNDDMRTGTQEQVLEELGREDVNDERNGLLNGPLPDVDTLEIGITRKEMGELLNSMSYSIMCVHTHMRTHTCTHAHTQVVWKLTLKISEPFPK